MPIITRADDVRGIYADAASRGWVLPCVCSENLTTTEAILEAARRFAKKRGVKGLPITLAMTCRYEHRSQAPNYTHTRRWDIGLKLFTRDAQTLCEPGGPFDDLNVMLHLDHLQHDLDAELLSGDLSAYSSVMYDASALPLEENIAKTAAFVGRTGGNLVVEGACDEIVDATGGAHNDLTSPEKAEDYIRRTGADMIVANLGTEHRAAGKDLQYHGDLARKIKAKIGPKIVLHGTSSVTNEQVRALFADGVCKVNIWTALERDSSPGLFCAMVENACRVAGESAVRGLVEKGFLTPKCLTGERTALSHFTALYRQDIVFTAMADMVEAYLDMWYT